ncbi:hypothetical protein [Sphingomonas sp.]|jgi:hypothetical protein|uniref:hypothetical protein n=1 Tax=Sphingomonas sp. TaxID=28214 RepID=UPI002E36F29D|nr:hypothetical protein [Sphingomonas sp.]HEX4693584.1 hypothetical protein [Sphingomonas sp.]
MTKSLQAKAKAIRDAILPAEDLADRSAEAQARLVATLIAARRDAGLSIGHGAREIDRALKALNQSVGSVRSLAHMHYGLGQMSKEMGLDEDYGPSETVPNKPGASLSLVA